MNNNLYNGYGYNPNIPNDYNNQTKYVENYLSKKIGQKIEIHVSFCDSIEWRDSIFTGILDDVGKDYIVINSNNTLYVIWNIYIDYILFPQNTI